MMTNNLCIYEVQKIVVLKSSLYGLYLINYYTGKARGWQGYVLGLGIVEFALLT